MDRPANSSDIVLNRYNLLQARSLKVLQSWLPPKDPTLAELEDEEDFRNESAIGGVGSKRTYDNEDSLDQPLLKKRAATDKLLETLLGRKAAEAHKRSIPTQGPKPGRNVIASTAKTTKQIEIDDEEDGRAAAISSYRVKKSSVALPQAVANDVSKKPESSSKDSVAEGTTKSTEQPASRPKKKPAGSYLDELLASKAAKKLKKKDHPV